jgi:uncharacterized protein involved in exopolysaccharide biosynthesis
MEPGESTTLMHDLAPMAFRHKGKMVAFFLLVMGAVTVYTLVCPRAYRSQAKLFVRLGRENATLDPTATVGQAPVVAVPQSRENEINSSVEILNSRILLEKVVDSVGPRAILYGQEPAPTAEAVAPWDEERYRAVTRLTKKLNVEPVKKSNVILVSYDGPTPELAQAVVSKLVSYYQERHIQLNRNPGAHQFFAEQTARQQSQLSHAEEALRDLKNETGLIAPEAQRQVVVNRVGRLQDELLQTTGAVAAAEAEVRLLREKLSGLAPTHVTGRTKGIRNEAADNMRGQLYTLQLRELEASQKYPPGHPDLQRLRQEAAAAKAILEREEQDREQFQEGPNRVYEEAQLSLLREEPVLYSLRAKADSLRAQLEQQRTELKTLNENSLRIARQERELALQESHYRRYAENLEQAQIDRALEVERITNISVVQPATYEIEPVQPRLWLNFGVGALLAALGSLALMVHAERRNPASPLGTSPALNGRETPPDMRTTPLAAKLAGGTP